MFSLLRISLKAGGGLATLAVAFFYSIHLEWIKLDIFSPLSAEQTFSFLIYSLIAALTVFVILVLIHYLEKRNTGSGIREASSIACAEKNSVAVSSTGKGNVSVNMGKNNVK